MQPILSRPQIRAFDRDAIARGVPGLVLMENAGRGAARVVLDRLASQNRCGRVVVLCGGGNNGGDGYVVARQLQVVGVEVQLLSAVPRSHLRGDAAVQAQAWDAVNGATGDRESIPDVADVKEALSRADVVVDALLGTGASRNVEGTLAAWIEAINEAGREVVALDIPSGLDADTGQVLGVVVKAHTTVTFAHYKRGLLTTAGHAHAGHLVRAHIGVPPTAFAWGSEPAPAAWLLEKADLARALEMRPPTAHKGVSGRVGIVAGSPGKVGAARLSARGALRAGGGLVTVVARPEAAHQLEMSAIEEMTARINPQAPERALDALSPHAWVLGPGLGLDEEAGHIAASVLRRSEPVVIDADALHLLAQGDVRSEPVGPRLMTPHPGEAARLLGMSVGEVEQDRFRAAQELAERHGAVVVLKGSRTIVAQPGEVPRVSPWGSPVLATGGTGDVLAGILGALLVGHRAFEAAWLGVSVHALAGESCARASNFAHPADRGVLARQIADALPWVLSELVGAEAGLHGSA